MSDKKSDDKRQTEHEHRFLSIPDSDNDPDSLAARVAEMVRQLQTVRPLGSSWSLPSSPIFHVTSEGEHKLNQEIASLKQQVSKQREDLLAEKARSGQAQKKLESLTTTLEELQTKETLSFVLHRIHADARRVLLASREFQDKFLKGSSCKAFVMSVDIRRSTELMLKARSPQLYAGFITELCAKLREIILDSQGVFDKFTGDGVLAFFPDFYSGEDAGYRAVATAERCHEAFREHYSKSRGCFVAILKNIGLGIGIDYGDTHLVQVGDGLTVVGTPVVYACRMAGAIAGATLLNQPAHEEIFLKFSAYCSFDEDELEVKHEGLHLGYQVRLNGKKYSSKPQGWLSFSKEDPAGEAKPVVQK